MNKDLQQFEFGTVKRSEIKFAEYNPRIIDDSNQKKLIANLKQNGLIEPVVWNKQTGNLVGGHQRLTAADKLYKNKDYDVPVAIINVDKRREKILNVNLNNSTEQGDWDLNALLEINQEDNIGFDELGFDDGDIDLMFGGQLDDDEADEQQDDSESSTIDDNPVEDEKDKLAAFNEKKAAFRRKDNDETVIDFYVKVVFPDNKTKQEVFRKCNIPDYENFVRWDQLKRYFKND